VLVALLAIAFAYEPPQNKYWEEVRAATENDQITVFIYLRQRNLDVLKQLHDDISYPQSKDYGKMYKAQEVLDLIAPSTEVQNLVLTWLKSEGEVISLENNQDSIKLVAKAPLVERLFQTSLSVYNHISIPKFTTVRQKLFNSYTLPSAIQEHIDIITGLSDYPIARKSRNMDYMNQQDGTYDFIIPEVIRRVYNIPNDTAGGNPANGQCAMEFLPVGMPLESDTMSFCEQADETYTPYSMVIGPQDQGENTESTLDVQYLTTVGSKVPNWYWTIANGWALEMANELFNYANSHSVYPYVISVSYGWPEMFTCQSSITHAHCNGSDAQNYVTRANTEFMKTNMLRMSFLICAQDEGAPSEANEGCALDSTDHPDFGIYPCSSPYVTCVAATTIGPESSTAKKQSAQIKQNAMFEVLNNAENFPPICDSYPCALSNQEMPCEPNNTLYTWTTGGGFSEYATRPSYQDSQVMSYLSSGAFMPPPEKFKNSANRGYPDVAAVGARILIVSGGAVTPEAGTSASTPIFAGVISLLNEWRLNNQKTPLGFLNPILYTMSTSNPDTFHDIIGGDNRCTIGTCCMYGFGAVQGWDASSGLGTADYQNMLTYVQTLP